MKKFLLPLFILIFSNFSLFSFDWPQADVTADSINSYFGQNRGGLINTSIVFKDTDEIKASEDGRVLIIMSNLSDDSDFFPTALGTSVIISHPDNLASVYGNMDTDSITINDSDNNIVEKGSIIGTVGNTSWQEQQNGLEFQILDFQNESAINPKILLSRTEKELPLTVSGILLYNKNGDYFDINTTKIFPAGLYKIYRQRNLISNPYKTNILVNGIQLDVLTYDTLVQENNLVCVNGKRKYTTSEIYPDNKLQLMGEVMLSPGKSKLELIATDLLNNNKRAVYSISIY